MSRSVALLALIACAPEERAPDAVRHWVIPPGPAAWPIGAATGRVGRSQAPQVVVREGIEGPQASPLIAPTAWAVPGTADAIVYGQDHGKPALERIAIDRGVIVWRTGDAAPVVGVTDKEIVCADAHGTTAFGLDGKVRWKHDATFVAMTDDRVVEAGAGESVISDAETGDELARVKLPAGVSTETVIASCGDAGRELFAVGRDTKLTHVVEGKGGAQVAWSVALGKVFDIEACTGDTVLVRSATDAGLTLYALARATGAITGQVDHMRGYWPARDGSDKIEVSTDTGVTVRARTLTGDATALALPVLEDLLAKHGDRRLVRATRSTAVLLDHTGVRAYLPLDEQSAVLGEDSVLAAYWGLPAQTVRRLRIPPPYRRVLRLWPDRAPVAVPAELRDLPPVGELPPGVAKPGTGMYLVPGLALAPDAVYVAALEGNEGQQHTASVARFDLGASTWRWQRADGCGPSVFAGIAAARDVVVCAANAESAATVRATAVDGTPRWEWRGGWVDAIAAAGDIVLVSEADRVHVLDAGDGHVLGELASDDGGPMHAVALDVHGMAMLVTVERGRVIGRLVHAGFVPAWSVEVAGWVSTLQPSADGVLVSLEDGDAYRIDARTGATSAMPGIGLEWRALGDLVTGAAPGGPIPPEKMPEPPRPTLPLPKPPPPPKDPNLLPPPIATPWPPPPPMADSWQLTLYELAGGLRARNDYALSPAVIPVQIRGPGDSPLVVESGSDARELMVIDPRRGDPLRRVHLPHEAGPAFSTVIDGKPVAGVVLANPLRLVLF